MLAGEDKYRRERLTHSDPLFTLLLVYCEADNEDDEHSQHHHIRPITHLINILVKSHNSVFLISVILSDKVTPELYDTEILQMATRPAFLNTLYA